MNIFYPDFAAMLRNGRMPALALRAFVLEFWRSGADVGERVPALALRAFVLDSRRFGADVEGRVPALALRAFVKRKSVYWERN